MKAARGQRISLLLAALAYATTNSGCAVDFRSFSIDSISKMPFLGFEIKERKPKSNAPVYNSISRTESDNSRIEPAVQTDSANQRTLRNLGIRNPFNTKANSSSPASGLQPSAQPQSSIAIPVTFIEGARASIDREADPAAFDFQ